jgi:hypothetical protein
MKISILALVSFAGAVAPANAYDIVKVARKLAGELSVEDGREMARILSHMRLPAFGAPNARHLDEVPQCGEIYEKFSMLEVQSLVENALEAMELPYDTVSMFNKVIMPQFKFGIETRKVCAKCSDFGASLGCLPTDYGYDTIHSGVLFLPTEDGGNIKSGTHMGTIVMHGGDGGILNVPSNLHFGKEDERESLISQSWFLTSLIGTTLIMPDYSGAGESAGSLYRPYLLKRSYQVATLPLLRKAEEILKKETNCAAAMDDAFYIFGHREGGYGAVAVADMLATMGKTIISLTSSGAPFRLATAQLKFFAEKALANDFPEEARHLLPLIGSSFSSTSPLDNFGMNQDLLSSDIRESVVAAVNSEADESALAELVDDKEPLKMFNSTFVTNMLLAVSNDLSGPCDPSLLTMDTTLLCAALVKQDLVSTLLSARYPRNLCHSPNDNVIAFENIPSQDEIAEFSAQSTEGADSMKMMSVTQAEQPTAAACFQDLMFHFTLDASYEEYSPVKIKSASVGGCNAAVIDNEAQAAPEAEAEAAPEAEAEAAPEAEAEAAPEAEAEAAPEAEAEAAPEA